MPNTTEYATYIIDLTDAILEHRKGLNKEQFQRIGLINLRAVEFITGFMQNESIPAPALLRYLVQDAQEPLRVMRGNCKKLLSGECGELDEHYAEALTEIQDCIHAIAADIQHLRHDLQDFMTTIGIETSD